MRMRPVNSSLSSEAAPEHKTQSGLHRLLWLCLPLMLALSALVLFVFGVSWWTAVVVVVLLGCPAAIGAAIYLGLFKETPTNWRI